MNLRTFVSAVGPSCPAPARRVQRAARAGALAIVWLCAAASAAHADTRYVNVALTTGADDGSSWENAYRTVDGVSRAIAAAAPGDEVWVAAGTYKPTATTNRAISVNLRSSVAIYGGFAGHEASRDQRDFTTNITILSGDLAGNDPVITDNSIHVVNGNGANATAILDGFTITAGYANGASASDQDRGGGMIFLNNSNATVRNCLITGNRVTFGGGGTYIRSASPTFVDCTWLGNQGGSFGGAIDMFTNCSPSFTRCAFIANAAVRAGGVEVFGGCQPSFTNCIFRGNAAGSQGGGGLFVASSSLATLRHCTFVGNTTTGSGSAILTSSSTTRVLNSIVYFNTGSGGTTLNQLAGATNIANYSCIQNGFAGTGNISAAPVFADQAAGDLRLVSGSPGIDAARNLDSGLNNTVDFAMNPRFVDDPATPDTGDGAAPLADMGAFELQVDAPACPADWNGDEAVNSNDISAFLASWLSDVVNGTTDADFDNSGQTNSNDISGFLAAWLAALQNGC